MSARPASHPAGRPAGGPASAASAAALAAVLLLVPGCGPGGPAPPPEEAVRVPSEGSVIIYVEAPRRIAGPLLRTFEELSGIDVRPVYRRELGESFEATLRSEAAAGRVDLVWADSPLTACGLAEAGLAAPFRPAGARPILPQYRDLRYRWIGFAANPRVIIYNSDLVERREAPASLHDLVEGPWAGRGALARPSRGGAAFHAAALFAAWGPERAGEFFDTVRANGTRVVEDDATVRRLVASGGVPWGFIGLDEAICAKREADPIHIAYPDRVRAPGTAMPPQAVMVMRAAPDPGPAKGLAAWLFEKEAGFVLGTHDCAFVSLLPDVPKHDWVPALSTFNIMAVDNAAVCRAWREHREYLEAWNGDAAAPPAPPGNGRPDRAQPDGDGPATAR